MTIEELKELKTQTKEIAKNEIDVHANFDAVDWSADVCALINAEIARQSVTDADVEQAIKEIELINHPEFAIWEKRTVDALNLAIEALRQYSKRQQERIEAHRLIDALEQEIDQLTGNSRLQRREVCEMVDVITSEGDISVFQNLEVLRYLAENKLKDNPTEVSAIRTAIAALQAYQPWVNVEDRLPHGNVSSVLIFTEDGGVAEGQYYPSIDSWKQFRWSVENSKVTHWMPLPEPPKEE